MTPFVKRVYEQAAEGSIVEILCRYPTSYKEYKAALRDATAEELETAAAILKDFPRINGASRKLIQEKMSNIVKERRRLQ